MSAGAELVATVSGFRAVPDPACFAGRGKVEEIRALVAATGAEVVLFDNALTPGQERNLERELQCRVLDRTGLILDIFAQRAQTHEGKLQVELAQLQHIATRLVRGWSHLERQKGGIGLRGPGETQLETDRRLIGQRIKQIHRRLEKVRTQRGQGRRARRRASLPVISLVGYTNAGKSTLFNRLTGAQVYAADQLFATLDPTMRRVQVPGAGSFILADTVGFIRDLPHDLVAAFRATLEEVQEADLLLHVVDCAAEERDAHIEQVNEVIQEIHAQDVPQIEIFNKADQLADGAPRLERDAEGRIRRIWLSARTGSGVDLLIKALGEHFSEGEVSRWLRLPASAGRLRARLYELGAVRRETIDASGDWMLQVHGHKPWLDELCRDEGLDSQLVAGTRSAP